MAAPLDEERGPVRVLANAFETIKARGVTYDRATGIEDNFEQIAVIAGLLIGKPVSKWEVAMILAAVKLRRIAKAPDHADSYVDLINYAAFAASFMAKEGPNAHHDVRVSQADRGPDGQDGGASEGG